MPLKTYDAYPAWAVDCMESVKAILETQEHQRPMRDLVADFEGVEKAVAIRKGRPPVEAYFPCVAVELLHDDDPFVAAGYVREVKVDLNIIVAVKAGGGPAHPVKEAVEVYIGKFAAVVKGILNRPQNLQLPYVTVRGDSTYDSGAGTVSYGHLHGGAVRAAQFPWFAKFWVSPLRPATAAL